jgi:hypothetical protein
MAETSTRWELGSVVDCAALQIEQLTKRTTGVAQNGGTDSRLMT